MGYQTKIMCKYILSILVSCFYNKVFIQYDFGSKNRPLYKVFSFELSCIKLFFKL